MQKKRKGGGDKKLVFASLRFLLLFVFVWGWIGVRGIYGTKRCEVDPFLKLEGVV